MGMVRLRFQLHSTLLKSHRETGSLLKIVSATAHALQKPFPPAGRHHMLEKLGDVAKGHVNGLFHGINVSESDPPEILLHMGKEEKIGGGQVRAVGRVRHQLCVSDFTPTPDNVSSVRTHPIVLEPHLVMAIAPKVMPPPVDRFSHPAQHGMVHQGHHPLPRSQVLFVDDSFGVPEDQNHDFADCQFMSDLGVTAFSGFQPGG